MAGQPTFLVNVIKNENLHGQAGYPTKTGYLTNLGPPPPCKQALSVLKMSATVYERDHCRRTTSGKNTSTRLDVDSRMRQHNAGCILIFFNPQIFLCGFKNFHVHTYLYSTRMRPSTRIRIHPPGFVLNPLATILGKKLVLNLRLTLCGSKTLLLIV